MTLTTLRTRPERGAGSPKTRYSALRFLAHPAAGPRHPALPMELPRPLFVLCVAVSVRKPTMPSGHPQCRILRGLCRTRIALCAPIPE